MVKADADKIGKFLKEFKEIASKRGIYVVPREVNKDALAELGLTSRNRVDEILSLSVADYCAGPEKDHDKPGEVWMFGKQIGDHEVYIKLKIAVIKDSRMRENKIAKCISFHKAEYSLKFPYRERSK